MKSALPSKILLPFLCLATIMLAGCGPKHLRDDYPGTLEDVQKLVETKPNEAIDELKVIKERNDGKDNEKAAQALYLAYQIGSDPNRYGTPQQVAAGNTITPAVQEQIDKMRAEGDQAAHDALKALLQSYPDSQYALQAKADNDQAVLERRMDQRNSKSFNYQVVNKLVALTGSNPAYSYWIALFVIAIIVKGATFPLTLKMYKSQREMQKLQPLIKELQAKYKDSTQELNAKMMDLYKEHKVNPLASCLPMVVQFPFMIWIYNTIRQYEYHFANGRFLWVGSSLSHHYPNILATDLAKFDIPLLILYALSNFITMRLTPSPDPTQAAQQKQMSYMMTGMMLWFFLQYKWPAAFILYWLVLNVVSSYQQYNYVYKPNQARNAAAADSPPPSRRGGTGSGGGSVSVTAASSDGIIGSGTSRPRPKRKKR